MTAHLLTPDLAISSRVTQAAAAAGVAVSVAMSVERLVDNLAGGDARLAILDLNTPGLDTAAVVARLRERPARVPAVIAFGPHVHTAHLTAAREAGCDEVFTRGQFHANVGEILRRYIEA